jgi:hypothetical protein
MGRSDPLNHTGDLSTKTSQVLEPTGQPSSLHDSSEARNLGTAKLITDPIVTDLPTKASDQPVINLLHVSSLRNLRTAAGISNRGAAETQDKARTGFAQIARREWPDPKVLASRSLRNFRIAALVRQHHD